MKFKKSKTKQFSLENVFQYQILVESKNEFTIIYRLIEILIMVSKLIKYNE